MAQVKDLKELFSLESSIAPQSAAADVNGSGVDTRGFSSAFAVCHGDGTAAGSFKVQESDDNSTWSDVSDDEIVTADGSNDTLAPAVAGYVTLGYVGLKRYLRVVFTHSGTGLISAGFALGTPYISPTGANS